MTAWELWACVSQMHKHDGNDAHAKAGERLDTLYAADDRDGYDVWCEITTGISKLGPVVKPGETTH